MEMNGQRKCLGDRSEARRNGLIGRTKGRSGVRSGICVFVSRSSIEDYLLCRILIWPAPVNCSCLETLPNPMPAFDFFAEFTSTASQPWLFLALAASQSPSKQPRPVLRNLALD